MYNSIRILQSIAPTGHQGRTVRQSWGRLGLGVSTACLCSLAMGAWPQSAKAESVAPAPAQDAQIETAPQAPAALTEQLAQVDMAANQQDLAKLIGFYSPNFASGDGLTRATLKQVVAQFWEDYQDLSYKTELVAWEKNTQGYVVETKTTITGTQTLAQGPVKLQSTLHSRQHWVGQQITKQEILSEQSKLTSGRKPPKVQINLPQEVEVGKQFEFDVIVDEPLGNNPLLGLALEEPITMKNYLNQPKLKLELLPAGGLFKVGTAGNKPTSEWISAILVQDGGMTIISQRLNVIPKNQSTKQSRK
ncbi:nuclear transport factor 2 family protein [Acaryochloris sp. IP29b_bin.148]|uniref:nuclear transport factor 2 family protein n=1 Tax=Acaryochloris sp. IP29b_bin.148 TaxID=2969218 RepID=UPI00261EC1C9|nr:nuclear transport factor 2 family protein [Acaryochloris sp. IP29b_bin.148]